MKGLKNGCNYLFNLKQRDFNSTKYGDLVMDKADFEALEWAKKQSGENTKILYAQFFKDNTLFITNDQGWSELKRSCPTTTRFEQNNYIEKTLMQKMQDADNVRRIDLNDRHLGDFIKYLYEPKPKTEKKNSIVLMLITLLKTFSQTHCIVLNVFVFLRHKNIRYGKRKNYFLQMA